jgi:hypothetical protein
MATPCHTTMVVPSDAPKREELLHVSRCGQSQDDFDGAFGIGEEDLRQVRGKLNVREVEIPCLDVAKRGTVEQGK